MEVNAGRLPPHNQQAEQSLLGAMLLDGQAVTDAAELLRPESFYAPAHQEIFKAMLALYEQGSPVDLVTLMDELVRRGSLDGVGGINYLTDLSQFVPSAANARYYIDIVAQNEMLRRLIRHGGDVVTECYEQAKTVPEIIADAEKSIFDIALSRSEETLAHIKPALTAGFDQIEELYMHQGQIMGLSTGFRDLDEMTTGMHPNELILIAARPSVGKSSFAMNIAQHVALHQNKVVAVFSLEMSREQLAIRMLSSEALVDMHHVRSGRLTDEDWDHLAQALGPLSKAPLYIDDTPAITTLEMRSKLRRLKIERGLDLVIVDYLQLMSSGSGNENRQQEISEISRSLKVMSRELEVPIIALSQLSRGPETRENHRPKLSDLRESGAIEQDADLVAFLYRDELYNEQSEKRGVAEVIIAKQRTGAIGTVELLWHGQYTRFADKTTSSVPPPDAPPPMEPPPF